MWEQNLPQEAHQAYTKFFSLKLLLFCGRYVVVRSFNVKISHNRVLKINFMNVKQGETVAGSKESRCYSPCYAHVQHTGG